MVKAGCNRHPFRSKPMNVPGKYFEIMVRSRIQRRISPLFKPESCLAHVYSIILVSIFPERQARYLCMYNALMPNKSCDPCCMYVNDILQSNIRLPGESTRIKSVSRSHLCPKHWMKDSALVAANSGQPWRESGRYPTPWISYRHSNVNLRPASHLSSFSKVVI